MYDSANHVESEVGRDPLLQSTLAYWSSGVQSDAEPDPMGWEDRRGFVRAYMASDAPGALIPVFGLAST